MAVVSLLAFSALLVAWAVISYARRWRIAAALAANSKLPGPKGLPIIGSVLEIPTKCGWMKFHEWGQQYGDIYQVNLAGSNHIIIGRDHIAHDLLAKRSAIMSDRPFIPGLQYDNRDTGHYLPLMSKNHLWMRQRKFAKHIMDKSQSETFYGYPELESIRLLFELMSNPSHYYTAMESFVARVTCRLAWGSAAPSEELKQRARELLISVSPNGALGNKLPAVMALPEKLSPARAWEIRRTRTERKFFEIMQDEVTQSMGQSDKPSKASWMSAFLGQEGLFKLSLPLEGAYAVGMHGIAGALTIAAPMQSFCLAMCHNPQYQHILHEEIDRVLGDRMPTLGDMPAMPVLRAFIRETLRWRPPVPTGEDITARLMKLMLTLKGIPHAVVQDSIYNGYHIPAGSIVHAMEWSISRDPEIFIDPDAWNPMRWLDSSFPTYQEPLEKYPTITNYSQFGYGQRVCQGQGVVDADLFVGLGSVAWLFSMHLCSDKSTAPDADPPPTSTSSSSVPSEQDGGSRRSSFSQASEASTIPSVTDEQNENDDHRGGEKVHGPHGFAVTASCDEGFRAESDSDANVATKEADSPAINTESPLPSTARLSASKGKTHVDDPTMDFTTLLIAKPRPFKFDLRIRNQDRAEQVARMWIEKKMEGEFGEPKVYWKNGTHGDAEYGWGNTFS